jgi:hypothetical protein
MQNNDQKFQINKKLPTKYTFLYPGGHEQSFYIYENIICDIPKKNMICHKNPGPGYNIALISLLGNP